MTGELTLENSSHACIHIYIHVYIYMHICICTCMHIHICIYIYIHLYIYICIHTYIYIYTYIHTYTFTYIYTYIHIHTYIFICIHTYIYIYIYIYIYMYIFMYTHTYIYTYIHIYIYIFTYMQDMGDKKDEYSMRYTYDGRTPHCGQLKCRSCFFLTCVFLSQMRFFQICFSPSNVFSPFQFCFFPLKWCICTMDLVLKKKGTNQLLVPTLRAGRVLMILNSWRWVDKRLHTEQQNNQCRLRKR